MKDWWGRPGEGGSRSWRGKLLQLIPWKVGIFSYWIPLHSSICSLVHPGIESLLDPGNESLVHPGIESLVHPSIEYFFIWVSNPFCICLRKDCHTLVCFSFAYRNTDTGFSWRTMGPFTKKSFASCHVIYKQDCCIMPAPKRTSTLRLSRRRLLFFFRGVLQHVILKEKVNPCGNKVSPLTWGGTKLQLSSTSSYLLLYFALKTES